MAAEFSGDDILLAVAASVLSRPTKDLASRDVAQVCAGIARKILGPYSQSVKPNDIDSAVRQALKFVGEVDVDVDLLFNQQKHLSESLVRDWIQKFTSEHLLHLDSDQREQIHLFTEDLSIKYIRSSTQMPSNTYGSLNSWLEVYGFDLDIRLKVKLCEELEDQMKSHIFQCAKIRSQAKNSTVEGFAQKIQFNKSNHPGQVSQTSKVTTAKKLESQEVIRLLEVIHPKAREKFSEWLSVQSPVIQRGIQKEVIRVQRGMTSGARKVKTKWSGQSLHCIHVRLGGSTYGLLVKKNDADPLVILGVAKRNDFKKLLNQAKTYLY